MSDLTREEAIKNLVAYAYYVDEPMPEQVAKSLDMAIEALQVKTDGDTISRQDALKPFCIAPDGTRIPEVDCDNFPVEFSVEFIKKHLLSLPSAEAEWIPCSERLPSKEEKNYLVFLDNGHQCKCKWTNDVFGLGANEWSKWGWSHSRPSHTNVIAWRPKPTPYKESEVEE